MVTSKGNAKASGTKILHSSRSSGTVGLKCLKIYSGKENSNVGISRVNDGKPPAVGRKSVPVLATAKVSTTHSRTNVPKEKTISEKSTGAQKKLLKCDESVKLKSARKALVDITNVKAIRDYQSKKDHRSGTDLKNEKREKVSQIHENSHGGRSFRRPRVSLTKTVVVANGLSKKTTGTKEKNPEGMLDKRSGSETSNARKVPRNSSSDGSKLKSSLIRLKAVDVKTSTKKPTGAIRISRLTGSKSGMIATSRNASSMKRSGIKKTLLNKEAEIPANLSSENHIVVCTQESGLEKHHHAGSGSFDEKMTVITPRAMRSRRKSFTSSFIGECAHPFEMDKLPNIDDNTNPLEVVEYVDDIYQYYWSMELQNPLPEQHMIQQVDITSAMRAVLVDWLIEVHHRFDLMQETLFLMVELLDRTLSVVSVKKGNLQLVGLTALLLASKYEDFWHPKINELLSISASIYTRSEMLAMEKLILVKLRFRLNLPTPYVFMLRFLKAAQSDEKLELLSFYLIELCLVECEALKFRPSLLCASAIYVARCTLQMVPAWSHLLKKYTSYEETNLRHCADTILRFQRSASTARLKSTYNKFSRPDRGCVAALKAVSKLPLC